MGGVDGLLSLLLCVVVALRGASCSVEGPLKYNIFPTRGYSCEVTSQHLAPLHEHNTRRPTISKTSVAGGSLGLRKRLCTRQ